MVSRFSELEQDIAEVENKIGEAKGLAHSVVKILKKMEILDKEGRANYRTINTFKELMNEEEEEEVHEHDDEEHHEM